MKRSTNEFVRLVVDTPEKLAITGILFVISQTPAIPPGAVWSDCVTDADGDWFAPVGVLYPAGPFTAKGTWYFNTRLSASNGERVDRLAGYVQVED